ncbi:hypothetical protein HMP09_1487 [Sphingomonas sp. HMP9]|nr:hypothetical protein HMP09_1487 [Sphingomonas sp. HMP9]
MTAGGTIVAPASDGLTALSVEGSAADIVMHLTGESLCIPRQVVGNGSLITAPGRAAIDAPDETRALLLAGRAQTLVNDTGFPYASAK